MLLLVFMLWLVAPTVAAAGEGAEPGVVSPLSLSAHKRLLYIELLLSSWFSFCFWFNNPGLSFGSSYSPNHSPHNCPGLAPILVLVVVLFLFLVLIPVGLHSDPGRLSSVSDSTVQVLVVVLVPVQVLAMSWPQACS